MTWMARNSIPYAYVMQLSNTANATRLGRALICIAFLATVACSSSFAQVESETQEAEALSLTEIFRDQFGAESPEAYELQGDVQFDERGATLDEGDLLVKYIDPSSWVRIELDADCFAGDDTRTKATTCLWLILGEATPCGLQIQYNVVDGKPMTDVIVIDRVEQTEVSRVRIRSEEGLPSDTYVVEYRNGYFRISDQEQLLLQAYIENGAATVAALAIQSFGGKSTVKGLAASSCRQALEEFTEEDQEKLSQASQLHLEFVEHYRAARYEDALIAGERVVQLRREVLGTRHPEYSTSLNNLAVVASDAGQREKARELIEESLEIDAYLLGTNHPAYVSGLGNLAAIYGALGETRKEHDLNLQVVESSRQIFGPNSLQLALRLNNLAESLRRMGDLQSAIEYHQQALTIREKLAGENHTLVAQSLNNLAALEQSRGNMAKAKEHYQKAHEIYRTQLGEEHPSTIMVINNLALLYEALDDFESAQQMHLHALAVRQRVLGEESLDVAISFGNLSALHYRLGEFQTAEEYKKRELVIREATQGVNHIGYAVALSNYSLVLVDLDRLDDAEQTIVSAIDTFAQNVNKENSSYQKAIINYAGICTAKGEHAKTEQLLRELLEIHESKGDDATDLPSMMLVLNNLAMNLVEQGQYSEAEEKFTRAGGFAEKIYGVESQSFALYLNNLADLKSKMGQYDLAEELHRRSLQIRRRVFGDHSEQVADSFNNLAGVYQDRGDYVRAAEAYRRAFDLKSDIFGEESAAAAGMLSNLGANALDQGDYEAGTRYLARALEVTRASVGERTPTYASILANLGVAFHLSGDSETAIDLLRDSIETRERWMPDTPLSIAAAQNSLGIAYLAIGDIDGAEQSHSASLEIRREVLGDRHPIVATSLRNLAHTKVAQGKLKEGRDLFEESLDIQRQLLGPSHVNYASTMQDLSSVTMDMGDYELAYQYAFEAFQTIEAMLEDAVPSLSEAQAIQTSANHDLGLSFVVSAGMQLESPLDNKRYYELVWRSKSIVTRLQFGSRIPLDSSDDTKRIANDLRQTRLQIAQYVSAIQPTGDVSEISASLEQLQEKKEMLERELAGLSAPNQFAQQVRDATVDDLIAKLPPRFAVIDLATVMNLVTEPLADQESRQGEPTEAANTAPSDELTYQAFVIRSDTNQTVQRVPLGNASLIDQAVANWRSQIVEDSLVSRGLKRRSVQAKPEDATGRDPGDVLSELLWQRLAPYLEDCDTLVFIPSRTLHQLPWAALPISTVANSVESGQAERERRYLIEEFAVSQAAFGQLLYGHLERNEPSTEQFLAVGAVDYGRNDDLHSSSDTPETDESQTDTSWPPLPGTATEIESLIATWGDRGTWRSITGVDATEANLETALQESRYAHLATHGYFSSSSSEIVTAFDPRQSLNPATGESGNLPGRTLAARNPLLLTGVVLAGANLPPNRDEFGIPVSRDGFLTAEEIAGLDLQGLDLVTLSACETALGEIEVGEGVFGLQRAFLQGGAHTVVASLWKVGDVATQRLMEEFYRNLWERDLGKLEALRQAQLRMLNEYDPESGDFIEDLSRAETSEQVGRLPIWYWGAFNLSGDFR